MLMGSHITKANSATIGSAGAVDGIAETSGANCKTSLRLMAAGAGMGGQFDSSGGASITMGCATTDASGAGIGGQADTSGASMGGQFDSSGGASITMGCATTDASGAGMGGQFDSSGGASITMGDKTGAHEVSIDDEEGEKPAMSACKSTQ
jgi:hypothetical protein